MALVTRSQTSSSSAAPSRPQKLILNVTSRSQPRKLILNVTSRSLPRKLILYTHPHASIRNTLPPPTPGRLHTWVATQNALGPLTNLTTHPILHQNLNAEVLRWANDFYSRPLRRPDTSAWFDGMKAVKAWAEREAVQERFVRMKAKAKEVGDRGRMGGESTVGESLGLLLGEPRKMGVKMEEDSGLNLELESEFYSEVESESELEAEVGYDGVRIKRESSLDEDFVC